MDDDTKIVLDNHTKRIDRLDDCVDTLTKSLSKIEGSTGTIEMLVKWVILPLIVILGGLVGVKIAIP